MSGDPKKPVNGPVKGSGESAGETRPDFVRLDPDAPAPRGPFPARLRIALGGAVAVAFLALAVVSLGFVKPAPDGSWSVAWLFETTAETRDAGSAGSSAAPAASGSADEAGGEGAAGEAAGAPSGDRTDSGSASPAGAGSSSAGADVRDGSTAGVASGGGAQGGGAGGSAPSGGSSSSGNEPQQAPDTVTVRVAVESSAVGNPVSASGTFTFEKGATVYDALCALGLSLNAYDSSFGVYVAGINGLAEKEHGPTSGWVYTVNGAWVNVSADNKQLSDGDSVLWSYVTEAG